MGMDVDSQSGVIASTSDMLGLIRKKDLAELKVIAALCREDEIFAEWPEGQDMLTRIEQATDIDTATAELADMVCVHGEPTKYGSDDCYIDHADQVLFLWQEIIEKTRPTLPQLDELRVFDSGRLNGWDVPHGEACFIFAASDCFSLVRTKAGEALKKAIGHCERTEWTIVSY